MSEPYAQHFTAAQVCQGADISEHTLRNWAYRTPALVRLDPDRGDRIGGRAIGHGYSWHRLMQVAAMADLTRLGWDAREAVGAALRFSDQDDGGLAWEAEPDGAAQREPGRLFNTGHTLLIARPPMPGQEGPFAEVVHVPRGAAVERLLQAIDGQGAPAAGATVIDLGAMVTRVCNRLDLAMG